jgi:hypothetical protein
VKRIQGVDGGQNLTGKIHNKRTPFLDLLGQYVAKNNSTQRINDGKDGKEPENPYFSSVAATFEKAST